MFRRTQIYGICFGLLALWLGGATVVYAEPEPTGHPLLLQQNISADCDIEPVSGADARPIEDDLVESDIVMEAQKHIGTRYKFGGTTPAGFDCSGFVRWVYQQFDIALPRTAREQTTIGKEISPEELKIGDIVVFRTGRTGYHSGIYIGNDHFIHSPSSGKSIRETSLKAGYFANRLITARRLIWGPPRPR